MILLEHFIYLLTVSIDLGSKFFVSLGKELKDRCRGDSSKNSYWGKVKVHFQEGGKKAVVLNYPMPRILMNRCFYGLEANFMLVCHRTSWKGKNSSRNGGKRGKGLIKHLALGIHLEISWAGFPFSLFLAELLPFILSQEWPLGLRFTFSDLPQQQIPS